MRKLTAPTRGRQAGRPGAQFCAIDLFSRCRIFNIESLQQYSSRVGMLNNRGRESLPLFTWLSTPLRSSSSTQRQSILNVGLIYLQVGVYAHPQTVKEEEENCCVM